MYHIVVSRNSRKIVNAEVKRRNHKLKNSKTTQQFIADEIIEIWEAQRKEEVERSQNANAR